MNQFLKKFVILPIALSGLFFTNTAFADDDYLEQQELQRLQAEGKIIPVGKMIEKAEKLSGGKVVDIELDREYSGWQYEVDIINAEGWKKELKFNAQTGEQIKWSY